MEKFYGSIILFHKLIRYYLSVNVENGPQGKLLKKSKYTRLSIEYSSFPSSITVIVCCRFDSEGPDPLSQIHNCFHAQLIEESH